MSRRRRTQRATVPPVPKPPAARATLKQWGEYAKKIAERSRIVRAIRDARSIVSGGRKRRK